MQKETYIHAKRDLLSLYDMPEACQDMKRELYMCAERKQTCQRDLLSLDDMPEACQDAKETYVNAKRDVYTCKKRPVTFTIKHTEALQDIQRETYVYAESKERRMYMRKETRPVNETYFH